MIRFHGSCTQGSWHGGTGSSTDSLGAEQVLQTFGSEKKEERKKITNSFVLQRRGFGKRFLWAMIAAKCWISHSIFGRLNNMFLRTNHNMPETDYKNEQHKQMPFDRLLQTTYLPEGFHCKSQHIIAGDFQSTTWEFHCIWYSWICIHKHLVSLSSWSVLFSW